MNVFNEIIHADIVQSFKIGCPAPDPEAHALRWQTMAQLNPKGFRTPKKALATNAKGLTRGQRKRERQAKYMAYVSEDRTPQHMHSAARNRFYDEATIIEPLAA